MDYSIQTVVLACNNTVQYYTVQYKSIPVNTARKF